MKVKNKANQKFNVHKAKSDIQKFLGQETKGLNKFPAKTKSRKQQRKEERQMKKAAKQAYYMKKSGKHAEAESCSEDDDEMPVEEISKPQKQNVKKDVRQAEPKKNEKKEAARVKEEKRNRQKEMRRANKDEDKVIKKMEKLLKLNKRKSKNIPKSFTDDGLDYLLEICDPENREKIVKEEVNFAQTEEGFEEDLALLSGKADADDKPKMQKTEVLKKRGRRETVDEEEASDDFSEVDDEMDDGEEEGQEEEEDDEEMEMEEGEEVFDEEGEEEEKDLGDANEEFSGEEDEELDEEVEVDQDETEIEENEDEEEGDEDEEDNKEEDKNSGKGELWEDIYGRLRNKKGEIVSQLETGKYVPPAKRFSESKNADVERLERQLKGLLNRLAEQNLPSILSTVEELYLKNSRHTMNQVMTDLIFSSLIRHTLSPERLVMEHAVLIAALHANVGTEVGAQFIESTVRKFDEIYQSKARDEDSKNLDNLILIVSHLYNFKVIGSQLIFDILGNLTESFREKDIELILIIIRSVGFALRKDDPLSLKQVILNLQSKANAAEELRDQSRVRFMLDILLAIRNNNIAKIPNYDPSHTEHLRKILRNTLTRKDATVTQLKISYRELLIAHSRGRWWVVGSAWAGEGPSSAANTTSESRPKDQQFSDELLELARKQRMNTDTRRNIFCIIMSSEDYVEASERLLGLGLQNQQEREIINVLVDCCLHEKKFNPYYAYLAQKLLNVDRKYQMAFQFCLWDRFKELGALKTPQIMNLSQKWTKFSFDSCDSSCSSFSFISRSRLSERFSCGLPVSRNFIFLERDSDCSCIISCSPILTRWTPAKRRLFVARLKLPNRHSTFLPSSCNDSCCFGASELCTNKILARLKILRCHSSICRCSRCYSGKIFRAKQRAGKRSNPANFRRHTIRHCHVKQHKIMENFFRSNYVYFTDQHENLYKTSLKLLFTQLIRLKIFSTIVYNAI